MEQKEIWKIWHNGPKVTWQVSDQGNVKKNGVLYECRLDKNGYKIIVCRYSVHKAVAELFVPNPNNYNEVDHINGDKLDNRAINLQWCTHKQNMNNPITREKISGSMKIVQNKPEIRRKKSKAMKGNQNAKGKPQSEESNRKRSEAMKGRKLGPRSTEHRKHISESLKGKSTWNKGKHTGPQSEESKKKNSESHKNRKMMTNGIHRTYVKPEEIQIYLDNGYHFGQK